VSRHYIDIMSTDNTGDIKMSVSPANDDLLEAKEKEEGEETDDCVEQEKDIDSTGTSPIVKPYDAQPPPPPPPPPPPISAGLKQLLPKKKVMVNADAYLKLCQEEEYKKALCKQV
jgi:hypothetical protein